MEKLKKPIYQFEKYLLKVENILFYIAIVGVLAVLISMIYGIITREFLGSSALWTNDFSGYAIIYIIFLGAPKILKLRGHVMVDLFTSIMKKKSLKLNSLIVCTISAITCLLLFYYSFLVTYNYFDNNIVMLNNIPWPKFALTLPIVIGTLFLFIRFCLEIVKTITIGTNIFHEEEQT
ncbi:TRAP-type C4-dicarboxylate transport system permease small subunit OS=Ureibacillus acetophenoni OX=614649 GN=SAMN05877842_107141 PE=4 SV=1 [Ureibacillus acetophenoni]